MARKLCVSRGQETVGRDYSRPTLALALDRRRFRRVGASGELGFHVGEKLGELRFPSGDFRLQLRDGVLKMVGLHLRDLLLALGAVPNGGVDGRGGIVGHVDLLLVTIPSSRLETPRKRFSVARRCCFSTRLINVRQRLLRPMGLCVTSRTISK